MTISIELKEIDNGFILTLFDSEAPSDTDKQFHVKTMKDALDQIVNYYEQILAFRDTIEEETE